MRIVNTGNLYHLYDDNSLKTYDNLPAKTYKLKFSKMSGFFLETCANVEVNEKIYGVHTQKVEKVFKSFLAFERHMGVILSGDKGIGKSLFAKLLSIKAVQNGYPLIIVDTYYPGIADFLGRVNQEAFVMFDEFEKTFAKVEGLDPQAELLTLFDGFSTGKKCFIITCNQVRDLNDYLVNRPGRFHYHFRFEYPTIEEVKEYLKDKLQPDYYVAEINKIISFVNRVKINYDCLRAIAFELNLGIPFEEAIKDINILKMESAQCIFTLICKNGYSFTREVPLDLFSDSKVDVSYYDRSKQLDLTVHFVPSDAAYDYEAKALTISGDKLNVLLNTYDDDDDEVTTEHPYQPELVIIKEKRNNNLHYMI